MHNPLDSEAADLPSNLAAPQHGPRPLPLFLEIVRRETAGDPVRMARVLVGLRAYQAAPRDPPRPAMPAVAEADGAVLRDHGGTGPPLVFIPSLINPPDILDLDAERSLIRWMAARDWRCLLVDWGGDGPARADRSVSDHVERLLVPLLAALDAPPVLVGYCLGGTMAIAAAALHPVRAVATLAAPWHFSAYGAAERAALAGLWAQAEPAAARLGLLPMEVLQSAFWHIDPARMIAKFAAFADLPPEGAKAKAFVRLEDWANAGPPLPAAAARELFVDFWEEDRPGRGGWHVGGHAIDPARLSCPLLNIASTSDRIVPAGSAPAAGERVDLALGHVGMIVGRSAPDILWRPLARWLSSHVWQTGYSPEQ